MLAGHNTQTAPAPTDTTSMLAELLDAINRITFAANNNAPISISLINQLIDVSTQMTAGAPLAELNDAISQLTWLQANNAQPPASLIGELNDVWSQLTYGAQTINPPDIEMIAELTQQILNQEPQWANGLWVNVDPTSQILTVQVTGIYTLTMTIAETPWWTHWPTMYEAASQLIATIYLMGISVGTA